MGVRQVLLFSGGLDSYIAYQFIKRETQEEPYLLYVPLSHRYEAQELEAIGKLMAKGYIPSVKHDYSLYLKQWEQADAFIPMRNSLLAHVAARYGELIWLTVQKGETNTPDRSPQFFDELSNLLTFMNQKHITVTSPFFEMTKVQMVDWYRSKELDLDALRMTSSCYSPVKGIGCGTCPSCFRRWVSLELNGIGEKYAKPPWKSKLAEQYLVKGKAGFYGTDRDEEIIRALRKKGVE